MDYKRTKYDCDTCFYHYESDPLYGFKSMPPAERLNLIGLILRDYADTMHYDPESLQSETECRALAAWCDDLADKLF